MLTLAELKDYLSYNKDTGDFTWKVSRAGKAKVGVVAGHKQVGGYCQIKLKGKLYKAHRLVWFYSYGEWPESFIDHVDGDTLNNKVENLREATSRENGLNRIPKKRGSSEYLGVCWHNQAKKWLVRGKLPNKRIHLGLFMEEKQAAEAYNTFAKEHYGNFARLNIIKGVI